jgi:hypothetical protein
MAIDLRRDRPRAQCPRESWQRFLERLVSFLAAAWRLRATAGCSPYYVGHNIISGRGCSVKTYRLADHEGNGFSFGFANLLGRERATLTSSLLLASS